MKALILVDIQYDFLPGGALAVAQGDTVIPVANMLQDRFELIVATQDYHPQNHKSFAINHPGKQPGDIITLKGMEQVLWPVHCVQETHGAQFAEQLKMDKVEKVFQKGTNPEIDSYSGFFDNGHLQSTGLGDYLKEKNVSKVVIVGLAADYCIKFTALDAKDLGFETVVVRDGTRAVNLQPGDGEKAMQELQSKGIQVVYAKNALSEDL